MANRVKLNSEELRQRMQEVIDDITDNIRHDAVNVLCSENTAVPYNCIITINIGVDMIPTITYQKGTYSYPIKVVPSERKGSQNGI